MVFLKTKLCEIYIFAKTNFMKQFAVILIFFSTLFFAQETKEIKTIDSIIAIKKLKFDSLDLKSLEIDNQLSRINYCRTFFNKLILNNNYKNKERLSEIIL
ncbi:hypothetical protein DBR25_06180 [Chryseobacterium sp. HMWF001]|nr:hypothetical protein DBR25_06180 [Chryseobacterium sp. HMWF001]